MLAWYPVGHPFASDSAHFFRFTFASERSDERAGLQPLLMSTTGTLRPLALQAAVDLAAAAGGGWVRRFDCLALVNARHARTPILHE